MLYARVAQGSPVEFATTAACVCLYLYICAPLGRKSARAGAFRKRMFVPVANRPHRLVQSFHAAVLRTAFAWPNLEGGLQRTHAGLDFSS